MPLSGARRVPRDIGYRRGGSRSKVFSRRPMHLGNILGTYIFFKMACRSKAAAASANPGILRLTPSESQYPKDPNCETLAVELHYP